MPVFLEAPKRNCAGPDGLGWNRLRIDVYLRDQCALQPRSFESLKYESWNTVRARWGSFGRCYRGGDCANCELLKPTQIHFEGDTALVRVDNENTLWLVDSPSDGWSGGRQRLKWSFLARLEGILLGERYQDEHSEGFWLKRVSSSNSL